MGLQGQGGRRDGGYAMAALLVALGVMSVVLMVAMPAWRHMIQREKEEELIFRGRQYARGIGLFQRKYAAAYPPDIETLVQQKFLRKKYRDPMVPDGQFQVLYQASQGQPLLPGQQQTRDRLGQQPAGSGRDQRQFRGAERPPNDPPFYTPPAGRGGTAGPRGGVIGVASKSTETSIRLYNGRNHYNEWQFVYTPSMFGPGQSRPGMRPGQPPGQPGQMQGPRGTPGRQAPGRGAGQGSSLDPPYFRRPGDPQ